MQFNYDKIDDNLSFEDEVRKRLCCIENALMNFSAQNDLVQELIRKELRTVNSSCSSNEPKNLHFVVTTIKNQEDIPLFIRISGRTYEIRDRIKQFGQAIWKGELKAWELEYSADKYHNIIEFLNTLTSEILEELIVVMV